MGQIIIYSVQLFTNIVISQFIKSEIHVEIFRKRNLTPIALYKDLFNNIKLKVIFFFWCDLNSPADIMLYTDFLLISTALVKQNINY